MQACMQACMHACSNACMHCKSQDRADDAHDCIAVTSALHRASDLCLVLRTFWGPRVAHEDAALVRLPEKRSGLRDGCTEKPCYAHKLHEMLADVGTQQQGSLCRLHVAQRPSSPRILCFKGKTEASRYMLRPKALISRTPQVALTHEQSKARLFAGKALSLRAHEVAGSLSAKAAPTTSV